MWQRLNFFGDLEEKAVIEYFKNQRKREDIGNSPRGIDCDKSKKRVMA